MNEIERICDEIARALYGPSWHGPALDEALTGVTAAQASARPVASGHTIWEIVLHLTFWAEAVGRRLTEEAPVAPAQGADWPGIGEATEDAWRQAVARLGDAHEELRRQVAAMPEARLWTRVPGKDYDAYTMLHGLAQHDAYHAGQIGLLKKMAG